MAEAAKEVQKELDLRMERIEFQAMAAYRKKCDAAR